MTLQVSGTKLVDDIAGVISQPGTNYWTLTTGCLTHHLSLTIGHCPQDVSLVFCIQLFHVLLVLYSCKHSV